MSLMKIRLPCSQRSVFADHAEFSDACFAGFRGMFHGL